jgi:hypothetical protein
MRARELLRTVARDTRIRQAETHPHENEPHEGRHLAAALHPAAWCVDDRRRIGPHQERHPVLIWLWIVRRIRQQARENRANREALSSRAPVGGGSDETPEARPPGWYRDPVWGNEQRYWDGDAWTTHVSSSDSAVESLATKWRKRKQGWMVAAIIVVGLVASTAVANALRNQTTDTTPPDPQTSALGACERYWDISMTLVRQHWGGDKAVPLWDALAEGTRPVDGALATDLFALREAGSSADLSAAMDAVWSRCTSLGWSGPTQADYDEIAAINRARASGG